MAQAERDSSRRTGIGISEAANKFGLSRATLLYYDRIGLLAPAARSGAGYRFYGERELRILGTIVALRKAGTPMRDVKRAIRGGPRALAGIALGRIGEINNALRDLKTRQSDAVALLANVAGDEGLRRRDLEEVLAAADIPLARRRAWHESFERESPAVHEELLAVIRGIAGLEE